MNTFLTCFTLGCIVLCLVLLNVRLTFMGKRLRWMESGERSKIIKSFDDLAKVMRGEPEKDQVDLAAAFRAGVDAVGRAGDPMTATQVQTSDLVEGMDVEEYDTPERPGFTTRRRHALATNIADETARSEIESLAKRVADWSGGDAYRIDLLEEPTGNDGDDKAALRRTRTAANYFDIRGEGLPFTFHRMGDIVWFEDPEPAVAVEKPAPLSERDFAAQRVPDAIEREAVAWMYNNGHRWTGREWVAPAPEVIAVEPKRHPYQGLEATTGTQMIHFERMRQIEEEGRTKAADMQYMHGELESAAACYAMPTRYRLLTDAGWPVHWPWKRESWKPSSADRMKELVKAGALIAAAIDRKLAG